MSDAPGSGTSQPSATPSRPAPPPTPPTPPPDRGSRLSDGFKSIGKALWFVFSLLLYALGLAFLYLGRGLIALSGWGADTDTGQTPPQPPRTPPIASA